MTDVIAAPYVPWLPTMPYRPEADGPLSGIRLAVKDLFDVDGLPTGAGNPTWLATHAPATRDAAAVAALLSAGARLAGKTHTDEMAYSLFGTNAHYGSPENPAAPGHLTGGSSNGTAAAVASGSAELGLGTDTGGSVRIPAGWCGLYGLRPSHARVSRDGVVALCGSFDAPGLLTADLGLLRTAAGVLLRGGVDSTPVRGLLAPPDLWELAGPEVRAALAPAVDRLRAVLPVDGKPLFDAAAPDYRFGYAVRTGWEFWQEHGDWVRAENPVFGPGVGERVQVASTRTAEQLAAADEQIRAVRDTMARVLTGAVLVIPTAPQPAPLRGADTAPLRAPILGLTGIASVAGLPALSVPGARVGGLPVGLCLVGAPGTDEYLLELAEVLR
ncbi:amidase [Catellatospora sp. TT07R-123]|uniref:amidase family protein n=1 Tax=Catellatospora sp. TT07R-123 TaxID=2733863 RepID=UPI001B1F4F5C|nr:amidase family protein [Catellatospora sp. TT07R-123]GHJ49146.1 amidase [Catellatospora sp. TT07R-123]